MSKKEKEMLCTMGSKRICIEKTDQILHMMAATNILGRVLAKCDLIDEVFQRQGYQKPIRKSLKMQMRPTYKICRNARIALDLEEWVDAMLYAVEQGVPVSKVLELIRGVAENKPTKK